MRQSRSVVIARPRKEVWDAFFADTSRIQEWVPEIVSIEPEPGDRGVGHRFKQTIREGGRPTTYQGVVTEWEEGRRVESELSYKGSALRIGFILEDVPGGTRVTQVFAGRLPGFGALLMAPAIWLFNRHFLKKQTSALKRVAEGHGRP